MLQDTLKKLDTFLNKADHLSVEEKQTLITLIEELKTELKGLEGNHNEKTESLMNFLSLSVHELSREDKNAKNISLGMEGLKSSVLSFETSHPGLVNAINNFCLTLSGMGI
jgi:hypothetical protein